MRRLHWVLSAVCLALLVYAARRVDWQIAAATVARASTASLMAALVANALSLSLRGVRWWIFLRVIGASSVTLAIRGAIVGAAVNNVVVANGGDAARVLLVAHSSGVPRTAVLATLALERLFDPVCFALLFLGATFVVPLPTQLVALRGMVGGGLVAGGVLLAYLARYKHRTWVGNNGLRGWRRQVDAFIEAARTLATGKRLGAAFLASVGVWVLQVGEFAFVANALHLGLPIGGSVAAMLLINTGLVLRLTPGNVGYFQFAYVVATAHFGVLADAAVASAILIQLLEAVPITLAGLAIAPGMMRRRRDAHPSPRLTGHPLFSMVSGGTNVPSRHIR